MKYKDALGVFICRNYKGQVLGKSSKSSLYEKKNGKHINFKEIHHIFELILTPQPALK